MSSGACDQSVPDEVYWFYSYADSEDFIGIGKERVLRLAKKLEGQVSPYVINRLLKDNGLPHGHTNMKE